ncbi:MAG: metallophosphoesterase [Thermoclostridium sp.]|nr:metallophosphoesterase [Thermoclostridium sp.]
MKWYLIVAGFLLLVFVYMFLQAVFYKTRFYRLPNQAGLRFLHMSDIHIGLLNISASRIQKTIRKANPDFILLGGDLIDNPKDLKKLVRWFSALELNVPVYCTLGNHDHGCLRKSPAFKKEFISEMEKLNIRILTNEVVHLKGKKEQNPESANNTIILVGLDDIKAGVRVNPQFFQGLRQQGCCILAFSHNPDIVLHIPEGSVDLLIAGHFHGGQMWLPFKLEYLLLRKDIVSKMGHIKGFSVIRDNRIYISRGLGTVLFPFRFFSVPEVTVFDA